MKVYLGETGLNQSWQEPFLKTVACHKCKAKARLMFIAVEGLDEKEYISGLHENREDIFWVHDACAVAVYLCEKCFEPNALINQA